MSDSPRLGQRGMTHREACPDPRGRSARRVAAAIAPFALLVAMLCTVGAAAPSFLSPYSLAVLARESSVLLLMSLGQTLVILSGRIDLSVAAVASLSSVLLALLLPQLGAAAVIGVLCCAALIGALHGLVHALAQVPSFVVTFAGLGLWSGIALAIAHASIPVEQGYQFVGWLDSHTLGLPHAFLFALAVLALLQFGVRRLPFGRYLYAIGNGERVALLSGVRVWRIKVATFATSAVCAALAGTVMVARTGSGNPSIADSLLLPSIAAVLVAGTAVTGGYGGLGRTLLGVLIVTVLRVGIAAAGIDPGYEPLAYGALVVVAASLTADRSKLGVVK